jgi:hypothetical protein
LERHSFSSIKAHPACTFGIEGAEAGAMLAACRLAGLSALEAHYAGLVALTQIAATVPLGGKPRRAVDMAGGKKGSSRLIRWPR